MSGFGDTRQVMRSTFLHFSFSAGPAGKALRFKICNFDNQMQHLQLLSLLSLKMGRFVIAFDIYFCRL